MEKRFDQPVMAQDPNGAPRPFSYSTYDGCSEASFCSMLVIGFVLPPRWVEERTSRYWSSEAG